jgi:predicted short-subunit dehydrogenase-like oxidoreductase (DUF2520 family)
MDISVVGAGRVGTALAVLLQRAGHRIMGVSGGARTAERAAKFLPGVPVLTSTEAAGAEVVIVAVPDGAIPGVAHEIAPILGEGQSVLHVSGASGLEALAAVTRTGARRLAVHPLQSFPTVEAGIERLPGSGAAVTAEDEEGFTLGEGLARDAGAVPFRLPDGARPLYHAAAVFSANYVAVVTVLADRLFREAGLRDPVPLFEPLSRAVLENVAALGPAAALTGPAARGEAETIRRNLEALAERAPEAVPAYLALADVALDIAHRSGRLPEDSRRAVEEVLRGWR